MLPNSQQIANPLRPISPSAGTSLSNSAPGTKAWIRPRGPSQRPANYLSRGALKPRPKLFRDGETSFFHRMYDEAGELVGVASPHVVDGAKLPHKPLQVKKGMVCGFFNSLLTDAEVSTFESENEVSPSEIAELINLFDDECGLAGVLTQSQLMTAFKKYRHYDPNRLLRERRLMFRMREHVLTRRKKTLQKWFDSILVKHGVKREESAEPSSNVGVLLETARSEAKSDISVSKPPSQGGEFGGDMKEVREDVSTPLAFHSSTSFQLGLFENSSNEDENENAKDDDNDKEMKTLNLTNLSELSIMEKVEEGVEENVSVYSDIKEENENQAEDDKEDDKEEERSVNEEKEEEERSVNEEKEEEEERSIIEEGTIDSTSTTIMSQETEVNFDDDRNRNENVNGQNTSDYIDDVNSSNEVTNSDYISSQNEMRMGEDSNFTNDDDEEESIISTQSNSIHQLPPSSSSSSPSSPPSSSINDEESTMVSTGIESSSVEVTVATIGTEASTGNLDQSEDEVTFSSNNHDGVQSICDNSEPVFNKNGTIDESSSDHSVQSNDEASKLIENSVEATREHSDMISDTSSTNEQEEESPRLLTQSADDTMFLENSEGNQTFQIEMNDTANFEPSLPPPPPCSFETVTEGEVTTTVTSAVISEVQPSGGGVVGEEGVPQWGSNFVKVEEHAERVGMTEFRKSLKAKMGFYAFSKREESCFFRYMNDVQFNAYAPAEVPVMQIEAALKHADRVHLEARMSVVLRKLDRTLRFNGMGLEDFFPARMAAGAGGYSVTGRARASPEIKYKLKHLIAGFTRIVTGKSKKKNNRPTRDAHWVTFYYTFQPEVAPWSALDMPDENSLAAKLEKKAKTLRKRKKSPENKKRARQAAASASAVSTLSMKNTRPVEADERSIDASTLTLVKDEEQHHPPQEEPMSKFNGETILETQSIGTEVVKSNSQANSRQGSRPSSRESALDDLELDDLNDEEDGEQEEEEGLNTARTSDTQIPSDRFDEEAAAKKAKEEEERKEDELNGLERTGVLKKYGVLLEIVEERNGWPWERVVVDLEVFSTTLIKVPKEGFVPPGYDDELTHQSRRRTSLSSYPFEQKESPRRSTQKNDDMNDRNEIDLGKTNEFDNDGISEIGDEDDEAGVGAMAAVRITSRVQSGNSTLRKTHNHNPPKRTWSIAVIPAKFYDKLGTEEAVAKTKDSKQSSDISTITTTPAEMPNASDAATILSKSGATTKTGVTTTTGTTTTGATVKSHDSSWLGRCALKGGNVAGFCFRLSHPSMYRIDAWCQTAKDINNWISCLTGQGKIPLALHSEKLPTPEISEGSIDMTDEQEGVNANNKSNKTNEKNQIHSTTLLQKTTNTNSQMNEVSNNEDQIEKKVIKTYRPPKKSSFMFSPAAPAITYNPKNKGQGGEVSQLSTSSSNMNKTANGGIGSVSDFKLNPSRRKICAFCGMGDEPQNNNLKTGVGSIQFPTLTLNTSKNKPKTDQRGGCGRSSSKGKSLTTAAVRHLENASTTSSSKPPLMSSTPLPPKPAIKWGMKPREIFIACPYGLVSDLACWPCLAANSKSSHAEQQANVTMPYRAHAARFHTSETVNGWNFAPPATVAEACSSGGTNGTTLRGFRTSMNQEPLANKKINHRKNGELYAYTSPHLVKYGPPEDVGINLDDPGKSREQGPYEPIPSVKCALGLAKQSKPKAVEERSESEEGWIREVEDDLVLDSRFDLDKRLQWINETAIRIAPLVKAQFRRALVQDRELRRRRVRLEKRASELVEIKGGIGTGVISGEAWIPALPTLTELASAKEATETAFKLAMRQRAYSRVTSLEEQLVAIESRQATIGREEKLAEEAYRLAMEEANRPKPRPIWDHIEGEFRKTKPLLRKINPSDDTLDQAVNALYEKTTQLSLVENKELLTTNLNSTFNQSTSSKDQHSKVAQ